MGRVGHIGTDRRYGTSHEVVLGFYWPLMHLLVLPKTSLHGEIGSRLGIAVIITKANIILFTIQQWAPVDRAPFREPRYDSGTSTLLPLHSSRLAHYYVRALWAPKRLNGAHRADFHRKREAEYRRF